MNARRPASPLARLPVPWETRAARRRDNLSAAFEFGRKKEQARHAARDGSVCLSKVQPDRIRMANQACMNLTGG